MVDDIYGETVEDMVEELEEELEESELDEMIESRRRRRRPRTASGRNLATPRPQGNYVTQAQLATAMAKVSEQIQTNSRAIATVNTRVEAVAAQQEKHVAAIRKEIAERKKQDETQRKNFQQQFMLFALLPLINKPKTREIVVGDTNERIKVFVDEGDSFNDILPLLLISGGGLGGGSGSDSGYGSTMMPLVLALALRD
jgi:hypothetical protein